MLRVLEFLTGFYWLLLPETIIATLLRANWRRAYSRHGPAGLLLETTESIIGTNTCVFFVPIDGEWDGSSIARLLKQYGIAMWGWGYQNHELFFHVRRQDAWSAQRIMWQSGVDLLS